MKPWQKIVAICGGAITGGLGVAILVYPEFATIGASIIVAVSTLVTGITGYALAKGDA